jgi:splicing factor 3A subunit 1
MTSQNEEVKSETVDAGIGMIYPPPSLRSVIDTTAHFVAKNGKQFETIIAKHEQGNKTKFGFLVVENPYHLYYKMRIEDFIENPTLTVENTISVTSSKKKEKDHEKYEKPKNYTLPEQDPIQFLFGIQIPEDMTPLELDIIKLSAQYVAKNGRNFLSAIAGRESRNWQFDFLKIQNKYFKFFTQLAEIYKKTINPSEEIMEDLKFNTEKNKLEILDKIEMKTEWDKMKREEKKREKEKQIEEGTDMIDWHDFVIVETIDFTKEDYEDLYNNIKYDDEIENENNEIEYLEENERIETEENESNENIENKETKEDNDMEIDMEIDTIKKTVYDEDIEKKIKKDYVKKPNFKEKKQEYYKDEITGKLIPIEEATSHLKTNLIDPRWSEYKKTELKKFQSTNLVKSDQISQNLENFAKKRTDIIGSEKELEIGKSINDENDKNNEKIIWDGFSSTISKTKGFHFFI